VLSLCASFLAHFPADFPAIQSPGWSEAAFLVLWPVMERCTEPASQVIPGRRGCKQALRPHHKPVRCCRPPSKANSKAYWWVSLKLKDTQPHPQTPRPARQQRTTQHHSHHRNKTLVGVLFSVCRKHLGFG
jgi:hypothetical protein